jgi:hypothetical protein
VWRTPAARKEQPMDLNEPVKKILSYPGTKANLARIGCNTFQRSKKEALDMLGKIVKICQGKD